MARPDFAKKWASSRPSIPEIASPDYAQGFANYLGAIPPSTDDHDYIMNLQDERAVWLDENKANLDSPAFTGTPTAPTPATGLRSTAIATMQKFADEFGSSLATNGYQKLPNGLIVQWGITPAAAGGVGGSSTTTTFPIAFPNACRQVLVSPQDSALNSGALKSFYTPAGAKTLTSFGLAAYSDAAISATFTYIAIGY